MPSHPATATPGPSSPRAGASLDKTRLRRRAALALAACLAVAPLSLAVAQTPLTDPLDDRSAARLDRMEKVVRELRAIIFQGRETGARPALATPL